MKFFIFAPEQHAPYIEGIQKSAAVVTAILEQQGHQCRVVTQHSFGEIPDTASYIISSNTHRLSKYFAWIRDAYRIGKQYKYEKPDAIIIFSLDWSFIIPLFYLRLRYPNMQFRLCIFSARECKGPGRLLLKVLASSNLSVWCASNRIKTLLTNIGISEGAIMCTIVFFTAPYMTAEYTNKEPDTIAYLSSADANAGIQDVVTLARALPKKKFTIAVRKFADEKEQVIATVLASIIEPNITVVRNIPNINAFLSKTEIVIMPPKDEDNTMAIPLVALEAAHYRCAVHMTKLETFNELFTDSLAQPFSSLDELHDNLTMAVQEPKDPAVMYENGYTALLKMLTSTK